MKHEVALMVSRNAAERAYWEERFAAHVSGVETLASLQAAIVRLHAAHMPGLLLVDATLAAEDGCAFLQRLSMLEARPCTIALLRPHDNPSTVALFRHGVADVLPIRASEGELQQCLARAQARLEDLRTSYSNRLRLERLLQERNAQLHEMMADLERSYDVTIEAMGDALDLRDEETEGHSKRVTAYTVALARQMELSGVTLQTIARGALLHDIGKIAIPDSILLKPGRLTPEEMDIMQRHCEHGYAIVRKIPFLAEAADIVYSHQEKFDGSGYPRGLAGEQIPLGARIFALADALDAMTSDRPYRRGIPFSAAIREIRSCRGAQFDPEVVDTFLAMPRDIWPSIRAEVGRHLHASELVRLAVAA